MPTPQRLPSSISSDTPAVPLARAASIGSALPPWPTRVAAGLPERSAARSASRAFSARRLPASMAPIVSSVTARAAATVSAVRLSNRVPAASRARRVR